jgi:hypothetical protein
VTTILRAQSAAWIIALGTAVHVCIERLDEYKDIETYTF